LSNIVQITNGGTNAEAYWSFDNTRLSFQAIRKPFAQTHPCDLIYVMDRDGSNVQLVSTGDGRDTCSYFYRDGKTVIFSSTSEGGSFCPPTPDMLAGYLWPLYKEMAIYKKDLSSGQITKMTKLEGYTAEATLSPDGKSIIFTAVKDGDLELYSMDTAGGNIRRLTYSPGYDGGAFYSNNGTMIVWRANRPKGLELQNYFSLLNVGLVAPSNMQLYIANADGTNARRVSNPIMLNATNFAPYFLPDDSGIIFSSDLLQPNRGIFHLYRVNLDGSNLQQITTEGHFNAFAMFSHDGKTLVWASDRATNTPGEIDIFTATWVGH